MCRIAVQLKIHTELCRVTLSHPLIICRYMLRWTISLEGEKSSFTFGKQVKVDWIETFERMQQVIWSQFLWQFDHLSYIYRLNLHLSLMLFVKRAFLYY